MRFCRIKRISRSGAGCFREHRASGGAARGHGRYARLRPVPLGIKLPRFRRRAAGTPSAEPAPAPEPDAAVQQPPPAPGEQPPSSEEAPTLGPIDFGDLSSRDHRRRPLLIAAGALLALGAGVGLGYALFSGDESPPPAGPTVVIDQPLPPPVAEEALPPSVATLNTTRIAGTDSTAVAAGVALAAYPPTGDGSETRLAVLAPEDSWREALLAGSLAAGPLDAPILFSAADEVPAPTAAALAALEPAGLPKRDGTQIVAIGGVAVPAGLEALEIAENGPAELAKAVDGARSRLSGRKDPAHVLVVSSEEAPFAMPAAAWAARSGDPIVFAAGDEVPKATIDVIKRHPDAAVYVLGPESVIGKQALKRLQGVSGRAIRVSADDDDPVSNAIAFARFVDGDFGWNILDPGHGFSIANTDRPADAGAGAPLAAGGKPGPLLLTDSAETIPAQLESFLLDTKPGFTDDPTRAVYNHLWLLGDESAFSLPFQAKVDQLTRLEPVSRGSGNGILDGVEPGPEPEATPGKR